MPVIYCFSVTKYDVALYWTKIRFLRLDRDPLLSLLLFDRSILLNINYWETSNSYMIQPHLLQNTHLHSTFKFKENPTLLNASAHLPLYPSLTSEI